MSFLMNAIKRYAHQKILTHDLDNLLEIHIPISPNKHFFTMIHYFAASLKLNGGLLANSRIIVTVGDDSPPRDLVAENPWSRFYRIEWRWMNRNLYSRHTYYATAIERFRHKFATPMVMMLDADTFFVNDFTDIIFTCLSKQVFAGLIAHVSPIVDNGTVVTKHWWRKLFAKGGLGEPDFNCEHTGFGILTHDEETRFCPLYFNLGVLIAPANLMRSVGSSIYQDMAIVENIDNTYFKCQIALTLAVSRHKIKTLLLPFRYNFPNDERFVDKYTDEFTKIKLFHYLRSDYDPIFDKKRDFANYEAVESFLSNTTATGVNFHMQKALKPVWQQVACDLRQL